jgi:hypothetical protein
VDGGVAGERHLLAQAHPDPERAAARGIAPGEVELQRRLAGHLLDLRRVEQADAGGLEALLGERADRRAQLALEGLGLGQEVRDQPDCRAGRAGCRRA